MKFARRLSLFLTSRWMRRLVWLPCILFGCAVLGATLESNGFRLSFFNQSNHQLPGTWRATGNGTSALADPYAGQVLFPSPQTHFTLPNPRTNPQPTTISQTTLAQPPQPAFAPQQYGSFQSAYQASPQPAIQQYGYLDSPQSNRPVSQNPYGSKLNGVDYAQNAPVTATYQQPYSQANVLTSLPRTDNIAQPNRDDSNFPSGVSLGGSVSSGADHFPASVPVANATAQSDLEEGNKLTHLANEAQRIGSNNPIELEASLRQLHALAIHQFQTKQSKERTELKKAKEALSNWEDAISERESLMKPIVESHLAQLLRSPDKLNWSFSGSQLLNSQTNPSIQVNYQEILSQLWAIQTKQQSEPTSQATLELPSHPIRLDGDSDSLKRPSLNGTQPQWNDFQEAPLSSIDQSTGASKAPDSLEKPTLNLGVFEASATPKE